MYVLLEVVLGAGSSSVTNISRRGLRQVTKKVHLASFPPMPAVAKPCAGLYIIPFTKNSQQLLITRFRGKILIVNNSNGFHAFLCVLCGSAGKSHPRLTPVSLRSFENAGGEEKGD